MRKFTLIISLMTVFVALYSCRNRKSTADYTGMIDSIRKAEVTKELIKNTSKDPVIAFFDTLNMKSTPLRYSIPFVEYLPQMKKIPATYNGSFNYESNIGLYAVKLPSYKNYHVILLAEKLDSTSVTLYLCTMSQEYVLQDRLCIYERKVENRDGRIGLMRQEYYVTNDYEITLARYFRGEYDEEDKQDSISRYIINKEGNFEETIIEL